LSESAGRGDQDGGRRVAIVTGAARGLGAAMALGLIEAGIDVAGFDLPDGDAAMLDLADRARSLGGVYHPVQADVRDYASCAAGVDAVLARFGRLDILVNNAAEQHPQERIEKITEKQLVRTFRTNIFAMFFLTKVALKHLRPGSAIVNTASVTTYKGSPELLDYSSTKGAIVGFTRSLSQSLVERKIRVNAVAPGPIWTPLIPSTFPAEEVANFGANVPMKRAGQPDEVATCFVFLASDDSSYMTGQVLHPNGGTVVNG
jgi:NAD(P)-dependent dehydrogenase (short-subunit alcohol dehydrogenase family)